MAYADGVPDAGPTKGPFEDPNIRRVRIHNRGRRVAPHAAYRPTVLGFKLVTTTPLLLVSKDISTEVQDFLRLYQPNRWHSMIESTIHLHRIVSPCPDFLDICSRSRFVFDDGSPSALWFLHNMPECMKPCVRDVVITKSCLAGGRDNIDAWDQYGGTDSCQFIRVLQNGCTSLKTIAVEVPSGFTGTRPPYVYTSATGCILRLLHDKAVNSVRLLNRMAVLEEPSFDKIVFAKLNQSSDPPDTTATPQPYGSPTTAAVLGGFDVLEESGASLRPWVDLGFKRALKITCFANTQLGTPISTRLFDDIS
jgi:hypothetical protein